jgi:8-oxo-dGTP diphosphatase
MEGCMPSLTMAVATLGTLALGIRRARSSAISRRFAETIIKRTGHGLSRLAMPYVYDHPRAALTVDCVVFALDDEELKVLSIQRGQPPFEGKWALPGGFVRLDETLEEAARRELSEETGLKKIFLEQLYTFGAVDRDPRERVVSVAYYALVNLRDHEVQAATDARAAAWFGVHDLPTLAFDHAEILNMALERLRGKLRYQPIGFELLPKKFTLSQLQHLYEVVLEQDVAHRAARLYRFDERKYRRLTKAGFNFEL